jgi:hypothetical protein
LPHLNIPTEQGNFTTYIVSYLLILSPVAAAAEPFQLKQAQKREKIEIAI